MLGPWGRWEEGKGRCRATPSLHLCQIISLLMGAEIKSGYSNGAVPLTVCKKHLSCFSSRIWGSAFLTSLQVMFMPLGPTLWVAKVEESSTYGSLWLGLGCSVAGVQNQSMLGKLVQSITGELWSWPDFWLWPTLHLFSNTLAMSHNKGSEGEKKDFSGGKGENAGQIRGRISEPSGLVSSWGVALYPGKCLDGRITSFSVEIISPPSSLAFLLWQGYKITVTSGGFVLKA